LKFLFVVHLRQCIHAELTCGLETCAPCIIVQHRKHQQHGICAEGACLHDLIRHKDEILAHHRSASHAADLGQMRELAAEKFRFSEH